MDGKNCFWIWEVLLYTTRSPKANSKYRLSSEAGALYSKVPKGKVWVCFKAPRRRTSVYIFVYLYR